MYLVMSIPGLQHGFEIKFSIFLKSLIREKTNRIRFFLIDNLFEIDARSSKET